MKILFRDIESRGALALKAVGAWRYAADPTTEVLCVGYAVDDGPVQIWTPGQPIPNEFITAASDPDWLIVAHNDQFETAVETRLLATRFGWPLAPIERHRCTMAMTLASALPGSLEGAAAALGLPIGKDREGHRLMMQMAKPRRPRKGENPDQVYWHDDPDRRSRLAKYCQRDVELERELYHRLPPLSDSEQALWVLDATINRGGFHVDLELAESARLIVQAEQEAIDAQVAELTDGKITSVNQVAKLTALLQGRGHKVSGLTKRSVSALLAHQPADDVRRLLELRQEGGLAAARKLGALIAGIDADQRLRGCLQFHAAANGRWGGRRFQPQNLRKPETKNLDAAIDAVRAGDLARVRALGAPLAIIGDLSRSLITAAPGHALIGADFSAVESRLLAWIAGETWKTDAYRKYDATGDPAFEPYCQTASKILNRVVTPEDEAGRAIGKTCDLAFGYGGGLGAWRKFDRSDTYTDDQVERFKTRWRTEHVMTVHFWRALENMLRRAIRTGERATLRSLAAGFVDDNLRLTLPSGRHLVYPEAHFDPGKFGKDEIVFKDNARGGWADQRGWFGVFVENVVAGVARDLLADAMMRLETAGYLVTLHVHDEIIAEMPEGAADVTRFLELMTTLPDWAAGLPLAAKGWVSTCYGAKAAPPKSADVTPTLPPSDSNPTLSAPTPSPPSPTPPSPSLAKLNGTTVTLRPAVSAIDVMECDFAHVPLPALIGEPLIGGKILCPFHDDRRPSLHIYNDHFRCFACGARGDHVDWLMMIENMTRDQALRALASWDGPTAKPQIADSDTRTLNSARHIWDAAQPIAGTLAARYLTEVRKIDVDALPADDASLRFHPRCVFGSGLTAPCLLACYRDVENDSFAGIHRIALIADVFNGAKVQRRTLGRWPSPRAIKFWPASDRLFIGEGVETTLAAATRLQYDEGAPMRPAWAAGPGGMISRITPVPGVKELVLLVDHDAAGYGEKYANDCRQLWRAAGRKVVRLRPEQVGFDFNDVVIEQDRTAP